MAQKPPKDQRAKPVEADRTVRLPRKGLGLEKDEPTQALQMGAPAADSTLRLKRDEMSLEEPTVALKAGVPAADSTLRLKRDEMSLEEPTVALKAGAPAADSTLRLKRDEMSLEEPTVALKAGVPAADSTLRLNRDEMSLEEPTQALERPALRTAMEVIDEATKVETRQAKPSVMLPDATDIPSWEESTQFFTPPAGGHADSTLHLPRPLEPPPAAVDPSDSMDETFPNAPAAPKGQSSPPAPMEAANLMQVVEGPDLEEDTLVLPDLHELDELQNAMKSTTMMPVMEAPAAPEPPEPMEATTILHVEPAAEPAPMAKTMVMPVMEAPPAPEQPEPMEATTILHVEPAAEPAPMAKTMVMPVMEAPSAPEQPEPMEATTILHVEPAAEPAPAPMAKTMVMPVMEVPPAPEPPEPMEATTILHAEPAAEPAPAPMAKTMVMPVMEAPPAPEQPEPMEATTILHAEPAAEPAPAPRAKTMVMPMVEPPSAQEKPGPMEATTIMPVSAEDPSAYLTRQGQSPWPPSSKPVEQSPASTQLMSESLLSMAKEATSRDLDSALAPVPPEVTAMEDDSPLARASEPPAAHPPARPFGHAQDRTVDTSSGMAMTPSTVLMPVQPPLEPTAPIQRPAPAPTPMPSIAAEKPRPQASQPMPSGPAKPRPGEPVAAVVPPSVPGYPDRHVPAPPPPPRPQPKPAASPVKALSPAPLPMAAQAKAAGSSSKLWIPIAMGFLLLVIGGIYFAFFRTSLKTNLPLVALPNQGSEPSLPVPADMQGTLAQAKGGDSKAMHMLGVSFYYGLNVPQNKAEGLRWMRKSAEAGNEKAKSDLRQMESEGR
ncbi:MAG: SEL1-like repeat protein [Holophagaceae bacterium]|nr:SEL1-like repeat protein [Holophagaceae bacterium]